MKPFRFHRAASEEARMAAQYYAGINPKLGDRFYATLDRLVAEVREAPQQFREFDPPARRHFHRDFPYALIYFDQPDRIWIVAVAHFKQRPGFWKTRLP